MTTQTSRTECTGCGQEVPAGNNFCTECGTPVVPELQHRPLFADEVDDPAPRSTRALPAEERTAPAPAPARAAATAATAATATRTPQRRRRRGGWLLALVLLIVAGGVGYALGHRGEDTTGQDRAGSGNGPAGGGATTGAGPSVSASPSGQASSPTPSRPAAQPQDQLHQVAQQDDPRVRRLVGSWVPQLAALTPGAGGDDSWSQALLHFRHLKDTYPSALLLDTGAWPHSYEHGGMYAVVIPNPGSTSSSALRWCHSKGPSNPQDCAAKLIDTHGSWADNIDMGAPGPG